MNKKEFIYAIVCCVCMALIGIMLAYRG